jgi:uncharacterized protein
MQLTPQAIAQISAEVERWLDQVVIGLNLCPFAAEPQRDRQIRIAVTEAEDEGELLLELQRELRHLAQTDAQSLETTLLVVPGMLDLFEDYNDFLALADQLVVQFGWEGEFQIASFHPQYCFADADPDDAENLTNRSPYPILHLLREASIEAALARYSNPERIPQQNMAQMRSLSLAQRRQLFPYLF